MAKKESGAAGRRRRKRERRLALEAQAARARHGDLTPGMARLKKLGRPPKDVAEHLTWASTVLVELMHQTINDVMITEEARRSQAASLADKLLKAYPRTLLEDRVKKLVTELGDRRPHAAAKVVDGKTIVRPPTARGARRGPRPVPNEAPEPAALSPSDKGTPADVPSITPPTEPEPEQ